MKTENSFTFFSMPSHDDEQRDRRQEPGQHDQQQADAVDADVVVDAERGNPRHALDELELGGRGIEAQPDAERHGEGHERDAERQPADQRRCGGRPRCG